MLEIIFLIASSTTYNVFRSLTMFSDVAKTAPRLRVEFKISKCPQSSTLYIKHLKCISDIYRVC